MAFRFSEDYRSRLSALPGHVLKRGGGVEGAGHSRNVGHGEFRDHRPYAPGDDPRDVDWHGFLRWGELVVKRKERTEVPEVLIILDRSASMGGASKDRLARELAGGLAVVALAADAPVSLLLCAEGGPVTLGTWRSHRKMEQLLSCLEGLGEPSAETWLRSLSHLRPAGAGGRFAFLVSDFLVDPLPVEALVSLGRGRSGGCWIHVVTEEERRGAVPEAGTLEDPESGQRLIFDRGAALRDAYLRELSRHEEAVHGIARRHGLGFSVASDDQGFDRTVQALLSRSGRGS